MGCEPLSSHFLFFLNLERIMVEITLKVPFVDEIAAHIKRHKTAYIVGTTVVITAGVTYLVTRNTTLSKEGSTNFASLIFGKNTVNQTAITMVERKGPPSWITECTETGERLLSQRSMASAKGISEWDLSQHLNGNLDNVNGLHFKRIGMAVV
jgi:hypothetical protein